MDNIYRDFTVLFVKGSLFILEIKLKDKFFNSKLKDLLGFLSIAVFLVLGVGIYYHANLWPDHQSIWSGDWPTGESGPLYTIPTGSFMGN